MSNQLTELAEIRRAALSQLVDFLAEHRRKRLARLGTEQAEQERDVQQSEAQREPEVRHR